MEIGAVTSAAEVQSGNGASGQALLIEWDEPYRAVMAACLRLAGCGVVPTASVSDALAALERRNFDLLVWGVAHGDRVRRLELMGELRLRSQAPLIMVDGDSDTAQTDLEAGADQWLPRPFVPGALVGSIRASLRKAASSATRLVARLQVRGIGDRKAAESPADGPLRRPRAAGQELHAALLGDGTQEFLPVRSTGEGLRDHGFLPSFSFPFAEVLPPYPGSKALHF